MKVWLRLMETRKFLRSEVYDENLEAPMKRTLTILLLTICFFPAAFAKIDDQTKKALDKAKEGGTSLTVTTVRSDVNIDAVLIPRSDARRIFGEVIARNYAVIELNIGNKSVDSALLIQGVYIDYGRWAMSGARAKSNPTEPDNRFAQYQTETIPSHVASNEYHIIRSQLLDAQHDTWRNRVVGWLTFAASLASGFDFSIHEAGIRNGLGKVGTIGIPSLQTAWPDHTIDQLKIIDDFGFKSGKSIPRQGSDVIVCFFPIDKFLTPGFRKLYLKAPALFFVPGLMLVDKTVQKDVQSVLGQDLGIGVASIDSLRTNLPCFGVIQDPKNVGFAQCLDDFGLRVQKDKNGEIWEDGRPKLEVIEKDKDKFKSLFLPLAYLRQMTLNNITVTVDGVMTVDTSALAAKIEGVTFDSIDGCGDDTSSCFWTDTSKKDGVRTGTISGSYMTGGLVLIDQPEPPKIKDVATVSAGSNDQVIHFSFKLDQPIASGTKLTFTVKKSSGPNAANSKEFSSNPKEYVITFSLGDPTIDAKVTVNDSASPVVVTLTGKNLSDPASTKPPKISLRTPSNNDVVDVKPSAATDKSITLDLPADTQPVGC